MTHHDDKNMNALERALIDGYRSQSNVSQGIDVTQNVMRDIRRLATEHSRRTPVAVLDQLVWRTATITAAVVLMAIVLTVGLFRVSTGENPALVAEELESVPLFGE
jgi:anti-sigma-K factor RskA